MDKIKTLRRFGLFDAKVPRYTSYPPANRFQSGLGVERQRDWLERLDPADPISIYVHIPFCRRLCWFCACRTQGTKTTRPVDDYLTSVLKEIAAVAATVPNGLKMERLHLGGGTPTLLSAAQMNRLLSAIFDSFATTASFEFSVEVDPTDASDEVLEELSKWNLSRASVGVQDFDPAVQSAIGRLQSLEETQQVISKLRHNGVQSLNIDLLYGLPFQTSESLLSTLDKVATQRPDRLALYGYAHVPHMSKRQVMIAGETLPDPETRFQLVQLASERLKGLGYSSLGIDHFALPHDSLAKAHAKRQMKRNFQGYTDDPCETLIGFGASAISRFEDGYVQNAVATAAYQGRIAADGLAGLKGYVMTNTDKLVSRLIEDLMCNGSIQINAICEQYPNETEQIFRSLNRLKLSYDEVLTMSDTDITLDRNYFELARLISADLDEGLQSKQIHSAAI